MLGPRNNVNNVILKTLHQVTTWVAILTQLHSQILTALYSKSFVFKADYCLYKPWLLTNRQLIAKIGKCNLFLAKNLHNWPGIGKIKLKFGIFKFVIVNFGTFRPKIWQI